MKGPDTNNKNWIRPDNISSWRHLEALLGCDRERIQRVSTIAGRFYAPFDVRHTAPGKWRHIDNPRGELKYLQSRVQKRILRRISLPEYILGGVQGQSIFLNATIHKQNRVVVSLDLKNCFPMISDLEIFKVFHQQLQYREELAGVLTKLTTIHHRLPQGAPSSTMLANLALAPMHESLNTLASQAGLAFTAWVDDLIFSGPAADHIISPAIKIIQGCGYAVSSKKIHVMRHGREPQRVTGTTVNRGVSVGQAYIRDVASEILALSHMRTIPSHRLESVWGKIRHVQWINSTQGSHLRRLAIKRLPSKGFQQSAPKRRSHRSCNNSKRHRFARACSQAKRS